MRVLVHKNAASNYVRRCYRHARPEAYGLHNTKFQTILKAVEGTWLDVETDHLFDDQFNTAPIPGVSESGIRLMIEDVAAIEGDVRHGLVKCSWCYGYDRNGDGACDKCGKTDYLAPLKALQPVLPNETATEAGVTENT
jgi:hypothetical protein